jgi:hypothetical protein
MRTDGSECMVYLDLLRARHVQRELLRFHGLDLLFQARHLLVMTGRVGRTIRSSSAAGRACMLPRGAYFLSSCSRLAADRLVVVSARRVAWYFIFQSSTFQ